MTIYIKNIVRNFEKVRKKRWFKGACTTKVTIGDKCDQHHAVHHNLLEGYVEECEAVNAIWCNFSSSSYLRWAIILQGLLTMCRFSQLSLLTEQLGQPSVSTASPYFLEKFLLKFSDIWMLLRFAEPPKSASDGKILEAMMFCGACREENFTGINVRRWVWCRWWCRRWYRIKHRRVWRCSSWGCSWILIPWLHRVHLVRMTSQCEGCTCPEIPYFDCRINTASGQDVRVVVETDDSICVALQCTDTLPCSPIPHT